MLFFLSKQKDNSDPEERESESPQNKPSNNENGPLTPVNTRSMTATGRVSPIRESAIPRILNLDLVVSDVPGNPTARLSLFTSRLGQNSLTSQGSSLIVLSSFISLNTRSVKCKLIVGRRSAFGKAE